MCFYPSCMQNPQQEVRKSWSPSIDQSFPEHPLRSKKIPEHLALNTSGNCLHPFQEEFPSQSWFSEEWSIPGSFPWQGCQCSASQEHQSSGLKCWQGGWLARWLWALLTPKL